METAKPDSKILKMLIKDFSAKHTVSSIAKETGMTRVGAWKALKRLESGKLVVFSALGSGKTSACSIRLNWSNPLIEKILSLALAEDAVKNQRWADNFMELRNKVNFLIIYGSIIHSPKEAGDIDILGVTTRAKFAEIEDSVKKIQKSQIKKIHAINLTEVEFRQELEKPNRAFIDAVKKGVILFGQEKFVNFMRGMKI